MNSTQDAPTKRANITVYLAKAYKDALTEHCYQERIPVTDYVARLVIEDLRAKGVVDA